MSVSSDCYVLSSRGLCVGLITHTEESYRVWSVWVWLWSSVREAMTRNRFEAPQENKLFNSTLWIKFAAGVCNLCVTSRCDIQTKKESGNQPQPSTRVSLDLTHASISHQQAISYFSYIRSEFCSSVFRASVDSVVTVPPHCCSAIIYSMVMDVRTMILFRPNLVDGNQRCRETHCLLHRGTRGVWCVWGQQACATRWYQTDYTVLLRTYLLIYLLTAYSMAQSPSWEANWFSARQEILHIARKQKVHYRIHKCPPPVPILSQNDIKGSVQVRGLFELFVARYIFQWRELLAPLPIPKLENHPLSAVRDCIFNILAATLHIGGRFSIRNLRTRHTAMSRTHLSWVAAHSTEI